MEQNPEPVKEPQSRDLDAINPRRLFVQLILFLRTRLSLEEDKADPEETIEYIRKGVEFKGTNIWILIFAILTASIGLNMDAAAVIIGAMLISPLMGPIMGFGMGVGIMDFDLIKKSAKNLGLMVSVSVITSAIYFFISPYNEAQSELLARTTPTIWDVLIALCGGLAGIVAGSRKEKSNAVPGVAIATALMPPLCTAGFGLATGNLSYFFGAFYLFLINSVFISLSTMIIVRFLRYPRKQFIDPARETRVKRYIGVFVVIITLPSLYIAYNLVRNSIFEREARFFVTENFVFDHAQVISKQFYADGENPRIEIALIGEPISEDLLASLRKKMQQNDQLTDAELIVRQGPIQEQGLDLETVQLMNQSMKTGIIEDLYKKNEAVIQSKDQRIETLEAEIVRLRQNELPVEKYRDQMRALYPDVRQFTIMKNPMIQCEEDRMDTVTFAYVDVSRRPRKSEVKKMTAWLKALTEADSLKLVIQAN